MDFQAQIREEIKVLDAKLGPLQAEKDRLEQALQILGGGNTNGGARRGRPPGRPAGRPATASKAAQRGPGRPRGESLKTHIATVLQKSGKPMSVKEIAEAVVANGFNTENKSLAKTVSLTMKDVPGAEKQGRGLYQFKR